MNLTNTQTNYKTGGFYNTNTGNVFLKSKNHKEVFLRRWNEDKQDFEEVTLTLEEFDSLNPTLQN